MLRHSRTDDALIGQRFAQMIYAMALYYFASGLVIAALMREKIDAALAAIAIDGITAFDWAMRFR